MRFVNGWIWIPVRGEEVCFGRRWLKTGRRGSPVLAMRDEN
jgi:hypothetical protein